MSNDLSDGEKLARVVVHYGLIDKVESSRTKIICPFHGDKNPSLSLNFNDGFFYCFGCGVHGNAEKFVKLAEKKLNGKNDLDALIEYSNIMKGASKGKRLIHVSPSEVTRSSKKLLYDQAYDTYHGLKRVSWMSSDDPDVIEVRGYMIARGFKPKTLDMVGAKITYRHYYPLIFPMLDNGIFKGWVCRTTTKKIEEQRKYLYNKGFSRSNTLVGDYGSKKLDGIESKFVIVVEGFMDRLKFIQFGVNNAVAILGWKMSQGQIDKLKEAGIEVVVSALDNDECGRKGTEFLKKHFEVVRWCYLKGLKDPGDMDEFKFDKMFKRTEQKLSKVLEERKVE